MIARLKAKKENSQELPKQQEVAPVNVKTPTKEDIENDEETEEIEEKPTEVKKEVVNPTKTMSEEDKENQRMLVEREMLQNNGTFRVELLHQLQELNKAMVVIAGALVDNGKN